MGSTGKPRNEVIRLSDGREITLADGETLTYSQDSGRAEMPQSVKNFEEKRVKGKIEYGLATMADGTVIEERKGGKGSVKLSMYAARTAEVYTHIHPRSGLESGQLGGTFSDADINNFANFNQTTTRAAAAEGTYSITKGAKMLADRSLARSFARDYARYQAQVDREVGRQVAQKGSDYRTRAEAIARDLRAGKITVAEARAQNDTAYATYIAEANKVANSSYIKYHQWLLDHQSTYGYTYGLERR